MKSIDGIDIEELERRMKPGGWSMEGFLTEEQSLGEIRSIDLETIERLGVSAERIAHKLEALLEAGEKSDRFKPKRVGNFRVEVARSRKMRTCPWAPKQFEWCHFGKGVKYLTTEGFKITNIKTGETLRGTSLCVHLIRDHTFFGGKKTDYRIDPEEAVRVLEIEASHYV